MTKAKFLKIIEHCHDDTPILVDGGFNGRSWDVISVELTKIGIELHFGEGKEEEK